MSVTIANHLPDQRGGHGINSEILELKAFRGPMPSGGFFICKSHFQRGDDKGGVMKKALFFGVISILFFLLCGNSQANFYDDEDFDGSDLAVFAAEFNSCTSGCNGDFVSDGDVDEIDLQAFSSNFGRTDCDVPEAFAEIGPEGGVIQVDDPEKEFVGLRLQVPAGALQEDGYISVAGSRNYIETTSTPEIFLELQPSGLQFEQPVTVEIPFHDYYDIDPDDKIIGYLISGFVPEPLEIVSVDENYVIIDVEHFSRVYITTRDSTYLVFDIKPLSPIQVLKGSDFLRKGDILFAMVCANGKCNYDPNGHVGIYTGLVDDNKLPDGMFNYGPDKLLTIVEAIDYCDCCEYYYIENPGPDYGEIPFSKPGCIGVRTANLINQFINGPDHIYLGPRRPILIKPLPGQKFIQNLAGNNAIDKLGSGYNKYGHPYDTKYSCYELANKSYEEAGIDMNGPDLMEPFVGLSWLLNMTYPVRKITAVVDQYINIPVYVVAEKIDSDNDYEKITQDIDISNKPAGADWNNSIFEWIPGCEDIGETEIDFSWGTHTFVNPRLTVKVIDSDFDEDGLSDCTEDDDDDNDGVIDVEDAFPKDPDEWEDTDNDGIGDNADNDDDNDGVIDDEDAFPKDPSEWEDTDNDGVGNNSDNCPMDSNPDQEDSDGDRIGDACDDTSCTDADLDGYYAEINCGTPMDCDDADSEIHPGAEEICDDGLDNDCDELIDECHWVAVDPPMIFDFHDVDFVDLQTGWVVGNSPYVLRTTNGGVTWQTILTADIATTLYGVDFVDTNVGWVVGSNGYVFKTNNGGLNWIPQTFDMHPDYDYYLTSVTALSSTEAWITGYAQQPGESESSGYFRLHTTDGGANWIKSVPSSAYSGSTLNKSFFLNQDEGWMVGDRGFIIHTSDGGQSWDLRVRSDFIDDGVTGSTRYHFESVYFASSTEGWVTGWSNYLYTFSGHRLR